MAQRIMVDFFDHRILSTKALRYGLSSTGHQPKRVNLALTRLNRLGYLIEYKMLSSQETECSFCEKLNYQFFAEKNSIDSGLGILQENKRKHESSKKKKGYDTTDWFDCKEGFILRRFVSLICSKCHRYQVDQNLNDEIKKLKMDEQYKIQKNYHYWSLSKKGIFAVVGILGYESFHNLGNWQKEDNVFRLGNFLLQCDRKEVVGWLINRLRNTLKISTNVMDTVNEWYVEARGIILNMDTESLSIPELSAFKIELKRELDIETIQNAHKK